jgi:alpha-galactosidase
LARAGYRCVNIDDGWAGERGADGKLRSNDRFPDLAGLTARLHTMGLRAGIYSSPGRKTCAGYTGSFGHEGADALLFASLGFDLLKYDYCTYIEEAAADVPRERHVEPYRRMARALREAEAATGRRVDLSVCTAGWFDPWEWADEVAATMWRTTSDVFDTWGSVTSCLARHDALAKFQNPGRWNDPDMLVVGRLGWGRDQRPTRLTPAEQVSHLTLWTMLSAPLLIGCNLAALDQATVDLLANPEVLAVDQDALGQSARRVAREGFTHLWLKPLSGGEWALALLNRGPVSETVNVDLQTLGLPQSLHIRDAWRRSDLGRVDGSFAMSVGPHQSLLYRLTPEPRA